MPKSKRKRERRQKRRGTKSASRAMPEALYEGLLEADRLDRGRKWDEARKLLEGLDRCYPRRSEVLTALVDVYYELNDITSYQFACQRLVSIEPDNADARLMLAGSCLENVRPAMALHNFRHFLQRWPGDVRADEVRKTVAVLEAALEEILQDLGVEGEEGPELAALHEEVLGCLAQGDLGGARQLAEQLLKKRPEFVPAINNLGEVHFREGRTEDAVAAARRVLAREPNNFHALANLTRYLCMSGRAEEARPWGERLKSVESPDSDVWVKQAETFSYLGDDQAVLQALEGARQSRGREADPADAILHHLAAVATMRLGRESEARGYWRRALKLKPDLAVAKANLEDLDKPVGQHHGPWAYEISNWLLQSTVRALCSRLDRVRRRGGERSVAREARRYLREHPQVAAMIPILLDRGDPPGREFAFRVATLAETPELLEALRDFALSQRGPDDLRQEAAQKVREAGVLPAGPVRLWIRGEWHETLLLGFEIHEEATRVHQSQVEDLGREAMEALRDDRAREAEHLLKRALEIEPDALDLLNNLATAHRLQGRSDDWKRLVQQIHRRDPEYLFGRVNMALLHLEAGEVEEAKEMVATLLERQRFHRSEFAAMAQIQIELCKAQGQEDGARRWLEMWKCVDPDDPNVQRCQRHLKGRTLRDAFSRLAGRPRC